MKEYGTKEKFYKQSKNTKESIEVTTAMTLGWLIR